eukprot:gene3685-4590_t
MTTYTFNVDLTCSGCSRAVTAVLQKLDGVTNIKCDVEAKRVVCDSAHLPAEELLKNIQKTGKKASIVA